MTTRPNGLGRAQLHLLGVELVNGPITLTPRCRSEVRPQNVVRSGATTLAR